MAEQKTADLPTPLSKDDVVHAEPTPPKVDVEPLKADGTIADQASKNSDSAEVPSHTQPNTTEAATPTAQTTVTTTNSSQPETKSSSVSAASVMNNQETKEVATSEKEISTKKPDQWSNVTENTGAVPLNIPHRGEVDISEMLDAGVNVFQNPSTSTSVSSDKVVDDGEKESTSTVLNESHSQATPTNLNPLTTDSTKLDNGDPANSEPKQSTSVLGNDKNPDKTKTVVEVDRKANEQILPDEKGLVEKVQEADNQLKEIERKEAERQKRIKVADEQLKKQEEAEKRLAEIVKEADNKLKEIERKEADRLKRIQAAHEQLKMIEKEKRIKEELAQIEAKKVEMEENERRLQKKRQEMNKKAEELAKQVEQQRMNAKKLQQDALAKEKERLEQIAQERIRNQTAQKLKKEQEQRRRQKEAMTAELEAAKREVEKARKAAEEKRKAVELQKEIKREEEEARTHLLKQLEERSDQESNTTDEIEQESTQSSESTSNPTTTKESTAEPKPTPPPSGLGLNDSTPVNWEARQTANRNEPEPTQTETFGEELINKPPAPGTSDLEPAEHQPEPSGPKQQTFMEQLPFYKDVEPYFLPFGIGICSLLIILLCCCVCKFFRGKPSGEFTFESGGPQDLDMLEVDSDPR